MTGVDTVAIDVGTAFVDLAKWDGLELQIEKLPTADPVVELAGWLELLAPRKGFALSIHQINTGCGFANSRVKNGEEAIEHVAWQRGASRIWHVPVIPAHSRARWSMERHRLSCAFI